MTKLINKAVFPVAGMGTRFLPATKANPKEMLSIVDKPLIQYAVEEAVEAGLTELIFITGRNKRAVEDHFDKAYELENELQLRSKEKLLSIVQNVVPKNVNCIFIRQSEALGLGHAVLCAKPVVRDDPFAVLLADDLVDAKPGVLKQMVGLWNKYQNSVLAVEEVDRSQTASYGIVEVEQVESRQMIRTIVEKPQPENAPSNLAVIGRYILTSRIFDFLSVMQRGAGGEIQLTDAIEKLIGYETVDAYSFSGTRYDCGSKLGFLQASVNYGLKHPETKDEFRNYILQLATQIK